MREKLFYQSASEDPNRGSTDQLDVYFRIGDQHYKINRVYLERGLSNYSRYNPGRSRAAWRIEEYQLRRGSFRTWYRMRADFPGGVSFGFLWQGGYQPVPTAPEKIPGGLVPLTPQSLLVTSGWGLPATQWAA
tara:strand:- start:104 stop:502 length:399 start_codon:yes stop_codon:yes gene_type:complete